MRKREHQGAIRSGLPPDATAMQEVEAQAGRLFAAIGMETVANEPPPELDDLRGYIDARNAWIFDAPNIGPVAYLLLADVDGKAHIEQMSVRPSHHRQGIGRALLEHAASVARTRGYRAQTLTTFRDVPWNAPYYVRLGFEVMSEEEIGPQLKKVIDHERRFAEPRVAMGRTLRPPAPGPARN